MKYFAFSDSHGDYDALMKAVERYGYDPSDPTHTLISCGDNFGRAQTGKGSKGIYDYLTSDVHANRPICLTGNHEWILRSILFRRAIRENDIVNGEHKTIASFLEKDVEPEEITVEELDGLSRSPLMDWLLGLPYYFETKHSIFLHGFLPFCTDDLSFYTTDLSRVSEEDWERAVWAQTPSMILKFESDHPNGIEKNIVFGHWHTAQLRDCFDKGFSSAEKNSMWHNERLKLYGLDNATYSSHTIEMLVVEDVL